LKLAGLDLAVSGVFEAMIYSLFFYTGCFNQNWQCGNSSGIYFFKELNVI
jgi:hypothetical protein